MPRVRAFYEWEAESARTSPPGLEGDDVDILMILLTGLAIGAVAKFLMPGADPGGLVVTTLIGIAGAFVGGFLCSVVGLGAIGSVGSFVAAVVGAMLLLSTYRLLLSSS